VIVISYVKNPERIANKDQLSGYAGLDASGNGHVGTTHLGDGSANATTFLRGDSTWATPLASTVVPIKIVNLGMSPYDALPTDYVLLGSTTATNAVQINLPDASSNDGREYVIKKIDFDAGPIVIMPLGADTIDGDASENLTVRYDSITVVSLGSNAQWYIV
jgi:hypothetical protein